MKNKTIHAIVKYFYPVAAGIETNMLETYSVLANKNWDITIHTTKDTLIEHNVLPDKEEVRGLKVIRYTWSILGFWPKINMDSNCILAFHNFNVTPHALLLINLLIKKYTNKNVPYIYLTPHGGFTPDWRIFPWPIRIVKYLFHRIVGVFLINNIVNKVRAVSEWESKELQRYGVPKNRICIISNGLEDESFDQIEKKASNKIKKIVDEFGQYFLQIGRIYSIKNYETTIQSLVHLPVCTHFVIAGPVGSNQYLQYLNKLIARLGLESRVHFIGVIRGIDKYYLIRKSLAMVHMAHWESFCNVVHEAMSQGKVCIVADNTALQYLIKEGINGFRLPTRDVKALSVTLKWLLESKNAQHISNIEKHNMREVVDHSWKKTADKVEKSLLSMI